MSEKTPDRYICKTCGDLHPQGTKCPKKSELAQARGSADYATAIRDGFEVPLIGVPKSASLDKHVPELHNRGNDLEEWCEIRVRKDWIPKGAVLVEAYLTEREIVICGSPKEDDENHNCDAMGCTTLSHVLYRLPLPNDGTHAPRKEKL
jgi:hypothetical protein